MKYADAPDGIRERGSRTAGLSRRSLDMNGRKRQPRGYLFNEGRKGVEIMTC